MSIPLRDISVLIVDDSEQILNLLSVIIRKMGIENIYLALDGKKGLETYYAVNPSLVLLDNMLPLISGMEVLKRIKQDNPAAKVVMVSAISSPSIVQEAKDLGASDYIVKPYTPGRVVQTVKSVLGLQ